MTQTGDNSMQYIDVTAAILFRDSKVLIAKRKGGKHLGGKWEFPGGKVEPGETPEECLARELEEEFDIKARIDLISYDLAEADIPIARKLTAEI